MKERGLHELALDYLDQMQDSQLSTDEFRQAIPYHRGLVLLDQSKQTVDSAARARLLEESRNQLERFVKENPDRVSGAEAQLELASLLLATGQQRVAQANQLGSEAAFDAQRRQFGQEAREAFSEARGILQQAEKTFSTEVEKLPPTGSGTDNNSNLRQEYRTRIAQLRFLAAQTLFEQAQTYAPETDDYQKLNEAAAAELATVYEDFARTYIVGLYARLYEGRCYQAIGNYPLALGCYEELLKQNSSLPPFRKLIASAVHRKAEVLIAQDKLDEAIETCNLFLRNAKDDEMKQPEWLAVQFRLASALENKGDTLAKGAREQRKLHAEAREIYQTVSLTPGENQAAARHALLSITNNRKGSTTAIEYEEPKTFQAAYDLGKDAMTSYNAAKLALPSAEQNNPDAVPELKTQMEEGKEAARRYFRAASILVDDDTDPKLLNEVRYFLCWLYWESEDYYRAAVLGEFLAKRYPDHAAAASAAKLALASYERLYNQALSAAENDDSKGTDVEAAHMADIAEFIVRRWPGSDDADAAQSVLISFAIRNNRIEDAERMLNSASEESRSRLELQLGNAMWGRYLELSQTGGDSSEQAAEKSRLKESALKYLQSGLAAERKREPSETVAASALYLAQALLNEEQHAAAIDLLEDDKIGPLSLIAKKHSSGSRPAYAVEAYKAALRAYALATPPDERKALAIMKSLEESVLASGGTKEQVTQIYIGLGVALEKQASDFRATGRNSGANHIDLALAQFLDRISKRLTNESWLTRAWLAQMYYNLGSKEKPGNQLTDKVTLTNNEREYLTKARDAYQRLLADAAKDPRLAPSENSVLAARLQLGECLRALGEYKFALDVFSTILKERESSLTVQKAAAQTYQDRGQAQGSRWLENAIHGGYRLKSTGENRIWGWLKISHVAARAARSDDKYRDLFFEARFNVALCRYLAAMKSSGEVRNHDLAKAKQSIQSVAQVYPDLGGPVWSERFDSVLKEIQKASGQEQLGLREFSIGTSTSKTDPSG